MASKFLNNNLAAKELHGIRYKAALINNVLQNNKYKNNINSNLPSTQKQLKIVIQHLESTLQFL